jgi:hypothetical protein
MARTAKTDALKKQIFLDALGRCGNVVDSCVAAKLPRCTVYAWRDSDPAFATAWEDALEIGIDALEAEAIRRAHDGWLEPIYQGGKKVGDVRKYSDNLLITMLKGLRPEKYKDKIEHDVGGNLASRLDRRSRAISAMTEKQVDARLLELYQAAGVSRIESAEPIGSIELEATDP